MLKKNSKVKEADIDAYMWILILANNNETGTANAKRFSPVTISKEIQTVQYAAGYANDFKLARDRTLMHEGEIKYDYFVSQIKAEKKMSALERLLKSAEDSWLQMQESHLQMHLFSLVKESTCLFINED